MMIGKGIIGRDLRQTESETRRDTNLVCPTRLQVPNTMHRHGHDDQVADSIRSNQRLNHGNVCTALPLTGPLRRDWVAQEDA